MALFLDVESLGVESTCVVLSVGVVYVPDDNPRSYQDIIDNGIFIKFNASEQKEAGRLVDPKTLEWWKKQGDMPLRRNVLPSTKDFSTVEGLTVLRRWMDSVCDRKSTLCWTRGSLDQMALDSLTVSVGMEPLLPYNSYRDIRTALDCLYPSSKNGYVEVDPERCIGFDRSMVMKHSPEFDAGFDAAMLIYGK